MVYMSCRQYSGTGAAEIGDSVKGVNTMLPVFRLSQVDRARTRGGDMGESGEGFALGVTSSCLAAIHTW